MSTNEMSTTAVSTALLDIHGLRHTFPKADGGELLVLDGIELQCVQGQIVGLLGRTGSGKSTLLRLIAGASAIPAELRAVGASFHVRGWLWWRRIALPAVLPYYVTGAITASGGSWNASIVAEVASWGNQHLEAKGLGAYIAQQTDAGNFHHIVLGIAVMSFYVVVINRVFWRPLYLYAERKFRLG